MINGAQVPLLCPTHSHNTHVTKNQKPPPSPSPLAAGCTAGVAKARASATGGTDSRHRRDPACDLHADEPRLSRDPQADRAVLLCRPRARQGAGRDVAAIRAAVPRLFDRHDHARIAGRAGAGREFRQSGRAHLLALAIEPESFRDLPARLQRRRPLPDHRSGLRRGRAVLYPGQHGHGYRLRVQPLHPRDPEPRHRTGIRVSRSPCRGGSRPRGRCETQARSRSRTWPPLSISAARAPPRLTHAVTFR